MTERNDFQSLRPMERRVLRMREAGIPVDEIASRMKRSPEFIERVLQWTEIPRRRKTRDAVLTPLERRVLAMSIEGEDTETIARKFKRTERFIRQVEGLAHFRKGLDLIKDSADQARAAEQARA